MKKETQRYMAEDLFWLPLPPRSRIQLTYLVVHYIIYKHIGDKYGHLRTNIINVS